MTLELGSFFKKGNSHSVCEDYARSCPFSHCVALSDGCSSAEDTDFGSRILVKEAINHFQNKIENIDPLRLIYRAGSFVDSLKLSTDSLTATLLTLQLSNNAIKCEVFGDGVVIARCKNTNILEINNLEYPSGAPFYLKYLLEDDLSDWKEQFGDAFKHSAVYLENDEILEIGEEPISLDSSYCWKKEFSLKQYDLVAVLSDGIHSFDSYEENIIPNSHPLKKPVPYLDVIKKLFKFKLMNGAFLERRCSKFFKDCKKEKWNHYDDFSIGAIYYNENE